MLNEALKEILACPRCRGHLEKSTAGLACVNCHAEYRIKDGILCFFKVGEGDRQAEERAVRDTYMSRFEQEEARAIIRNVSQHHCLSVMGDRARQFRKAFSQDEWILDLGSGSGWCWSGTNGAALVLLGAQTRARAEERPVNLNDNAALKYWRAFSLMPHLSHDQENKLRLEAQTAALDSKIAPVEKL